MKNHFLLLILSVFVLSRFPIQLPAQELFPMPQEHRTIDEPYTYTQMQALLEKLAEKSYIELFSKGQSVEGRELYLVHINRRTEPGGWRLFIFAQQHGNEPAGKDALIFLIQYIAENPELLPEEVELWLMPMVNPDGAELDQRRNAHNADLNRDHILLAEPETQILHRTFREIQPHVAIDCHEFARDSEDYLNKGWLEWPLIMMDCSNNPLLPPSLYQAGLAWCDGIAAFLLEKDHNYTRYFVGGVPPAEEQRHSTLDCDDARNGLGVYGGLSFIIESGIRRDQENPNADLGERIDAYLEIFNQFIHNRELRGESLIALNTAEHTPLPLFIPTNYFWANAEPEIREVKVIAQTTGKTQLIKTANFMDDRTIKKSVSTPTAYIIPTEKAFLFEELLNRHAIAYEILKNPQVLKVEPSKLLKIETEFDEVYSRYAGRQITEVLVPVEKEFPINSIRVNLDSANARRAILLLEPAELYGLYQYPQFEALKDSNNILPVYRIP